ncbi:monofunctional biosynthetic peptidoglycan transglycosylase [Halodurantibacterium flavum]|uniref:Biosynthetic peptidoglycan transglycosylase n=1 Tax=Halodurantibacterium flavum TaxID=1382802 RepID=A0ABW4S7Y7_9RHOB
MAKRAAKSTARKSRGAALSSRRRLAGLALGWALRGLAAVAAFFVLLVVLFSFVTPPRGIYMIAEARRLGGIEREWVPMNRISPNMQRAAVAAEDANFCLHWGFDMIEIRRALDQGSSRGASTISQQVVKNVFLWHGRNWSRKAMEAVLTPVVETFWSKRRILEVYLNVAEFDEGVFGIEAAARHYFGTDAASLSPQQAGRLAAILPDPKGRSASNPSDFVRRRGAAIADGAATIRADGRSACFEG